MCIRSFLKKKVVFPSLLCLFLAQNNFCDAFIKELGIADCGVAYPQSATCARYNPAGIIDVGNRFDVGIGGFYLNGHMSLKGSAVPTINQKSSTTQCKWIPGALFGITKLIKPNFAVGVSTDAGITSSKGSLPQGLRAFGQGHLGNESMIAILVPSAAYQWGRHCFGVSIPVSISRIKANGFQNFKLASLYPNNVTNKGYDWAEAVNLRFGWLFHVTDRFTVGVSYITQQLWSSHFGKYRGLIPLKGKFELNPELRFGCAYHFCRGSLALQCTWFDFKNGRTFSNPVDSTAPLGSKHGAGGGLKNVFAISIGGDYQVFNCFTARGGVVYISNPFILKSNVAGGFARVSLLPNTTLHCGFTLSRYDWDFDFALVGGLNRRVTSPPSAALGGARTTANGNLILCLVSIGRPY